MERLLTEYAELKQEEKDLKDRIAQKQQEIIAVMALTGAKSYDNGVNRVTLKKGTVSYRFDTDRFKKEHLDIYNDYQKETVSKDSITLTKVKQNDNSI